jgi:CDP-diacylglycerol--glycerol-3-phosphate 3-phosphatidyltransferase
MSETAPIRTFGPSALATPANALTLARLLAAPVIVAIVAASGPGWLPFALVAVVGFSDGADGWIARRQGTTSSGAFLDPLADKAVVLGALSAIAARGEISWIPVAIIGAREIAMSVYRSVAGRKGVSVPARNLAKLKTFVQDAAVGLSVMPVLATHHLVLAVLVWAAAALTLASGVQYLFDGIAASRKARSVDGATGATAAPSGRVPAPAPENDAPPVPPHAAAM